MKILACNSNRPLAEAIAAYLDLPLTKASVRRFSDMEVFVEILENVRGEDVFVIQSTSYPANDHLMELLVCFDALKRGSARRVTAVIPYYGYARQDRKSGPRTPISAKLVANMITAAGADLVLDAAVALDRSGAGQQHVRIVWRMRRKDGDEIGTVAQENDVPTGLLDGAWGDVAYTVAVAAQDGIMALVARGALPQSRKS